jgi:hypothetical protein
MTDISPIDVQMDERGLIVSISFGDVASMAHADKTLDELKTEFHAELKHIGVKGMKWGKRKGGIGSRTSEAHTDRNSTLANRSRRIAEGKASKLEVAKAAVLTTSLTSIIKNGGLKGAAKKRVKDLEAQSERIAAGKATIGDRLNIAGRLRVSDLVVKRVS